MILSFATIIQYTINQLSWVQEKGLIDNFFVSTDYIITEDGGSTVTSRNKYFSIENRSIPKMNYFLKQPKNFVREHIISIIREQAFYTTLQSSLNSQSFKELNLYLPTFYNFDDQDIILILAWITETRNLREITPQDDNKLLEYSKHAGSILKKFHETLSNKKSLFAPNSPLFFKVIPLPIFEVDFKILEFQKQFRTDLKPYILAIEENSIFKKIIIDAKRNWNSDSNKTIIHGDFKAGNILVREKNNSIFLIDWEYAMWGSPEYDLASFYFYLLLVDDFETNRLNTNIFRSLLEGYYNSEKIGKIEIERIIVFCKARVINYMINNSISEAKDEQERDREINRLKNIIKIIENNNLIII